MIQQTQVSKKTKWSTAEGMKRQTKLTTSTPSTGPTKHIKIYWNGTNWASFKSTYRWNIEHM